MQQSRRYKMKKIYDKNELNFALIWIGLYVVLLSVGDSISASVGIAKSVTAPLGIVMTGFLYFWIRKNSLKDYLFFIPLILLASTNVWYGVRLNTSILESILYVISMFCIGFLEEIIFRGFLFKAMCKDNVKSAIFISSLTFGLGHIVNLLNGAEVMGTLLQVCHAVAIGFLFTIIFYKGKSLWPCIITHIAINSLSAFGNLEARTTENSIMASAFLCVLSLVYGVYILKKSKKI